MEREEFGLGDLASLPIGKRVCEASGTGCVFLSAPKPKCKGWGGEKKNLQELLAGALPSQPQTATQTSTTAFLWGNPNNKQNNFK